MKRILALLFCLPCFVVVPSLAAVSLQARQGLLFAPVEVEDAEGRPHRFLVQLDTGSASTLIDPRALEQGPWLNEQGESLIKTQEGHRQSLNRVRLNRLSLGGRSFTNRAFPVVTVREFYPPAAPGQADLPMLGVLGADLLFSSSFSLSLDSLQLDWAEKCPWQTEAKIDLIWLPGNVWALEGRHEQQRTAYLLDTGAFEDWFPLSWVQADIDTSPRAWVQWKNQGSAPIYDVVGLFTYDTPLEPGVARQRLVSGLPGAVSPALGTATLSSWDLWFEVKGYRNTTLHLKRAPADSQARFLSSVALTTWGLESDTWGFRVDPTSGNLRWKAFWGDGTPLVPELSWGDALVSIDTVPWGPGGLQALPEDIGSLVFQWRHAEALVDLTMSRKQRVIP